MGVSVGLSLLGEQGHDEYRYSEILACSQSRLDSNIPIVLAYVLTSPVIVEEGASISAMPTNHHTDRNRNSGTVNVSEVPSDRFMIAKFDISTKIFHFCM